MLLNWNRFDCSLLDIFLVRSVFLSSAILGCCFFRTFLYFSLELKVMDIFMTSHFLMRSMASGLNDFWMFMRVTQKFHKCFKEATTLERLSGGEIHRSRKNSTKFRPITWLLAMCNILTVQFFNWIKRWAIKSLYFQDFLNFVFCFISQQFYLYLLFSCILFWK